MKFVLVVLQSPQSALYGLCRHGQGEVVMVARGAAGVIGGPSVVRDKGHVVHSVEGGTGPGATTLIGVGRSDLHH